MKFDDLVKQMLLIEADDRLLGKSFSPTGFRKSSAEAEIGLYNPDAETYKRGTYIRTGDEATQAEMKALSAVEGSSGDPREVAEMREKIDDVVNKMSSVIKTGDKEVASGKILGLLTDFQSDYYDWKSKESLRKQKESSGKGGEEMQQIISDAEQAKEKLYSTASKGFAIIKASLVRHPEVRRALDVLANLKDHLANLRPGEGQDHTTFAKVATLHDLNARLKSSLIRKSDAPISVVGVKSSLKSKLSGDKNKLLKHIRADRFKKDLTNALKLAGDDTSIIDDVRDYYAGKLNERDLVTRLFL